jgi:serine/threonine protein kinase
MKIPTWAEDWMRAQRWFIETSAAIEASGSSSLMELFIREVSNFEALIDPAADLSSAVGESARIPERPPQLSTSLVKALANLKPVHVNSLDMKSVLFEHCSMPKDVADLLARCFLWNPEERISCKEALLHPALLHAQPFMPSQAEPFRLEGKQRCSDAVEALKAYLKEKSSINESSKKAAPVTTVASSFSSSSSSAMDDTSFSSISGISSAASSTGIGTINLQLSQ